MEEVGVCRENENCFGHNIKFNVHGCIEGRDIPCLLAEGHTAHTGSAPPRSPAACSQSAAIPRVTEKKNFVQAQMYSFIDYSPAGISSGSFLKEQRRSESI